jgi:hypothetical protein
MVMKKIVSQAYGEMLCTFYTAFPNTTDAKRMTSKG